MDQSLPFGFNVAGFLSSPFGLGIAARNTVELLLTAGYPVALYDIPLKDGRSGREPFHEELNSSDQNPFPYDITLFQLSPEHTVQMMETISSIDWRTRFVASVPFWELDSIPNSWIAPSKRIGTILAPTQFVKHAFTSKVSGTRVLHYPQAVYIPTPATLQRADFGIADSSLVFMTGFDIGSDLNRKNPTDAITAFCEAFPSGTENVELVIKVNRTRTTPFFDSLLRRLHEFASADKRIKVIDRSMNYAEIIALYACCDVYISLHRAEGFGLPVIENMLLGKPVVVTNYSGVTDFVKHTNCCCVNYSLVQCDSSLNPAITPDALGFQGYWAQPDVKEAVRWIRALKENHDLRSRIGLQARNDMVQWNRMCEQASVFAEVKNIFQNYREVQGGYCNKDF